KEAGNVEIQLKDIKSSEEECGRSLFGKVVGDRPTSMLGIKRTMTTIWKLQLAMEVKEISSNFFQFIFASQEDKRKVVSGHNWIYENQYLILKEWFPGLHSSHKCFDEVMIWVQILNVPLNWMSTEVGMRIGQIFNRVNNVVICKMGGEQGSFIKILVALNLKEPIPRCTSVKLGEERVLVAFRYERLVNLCYYCGHIGHLHRGCKIREENIENNSVEEGLFGELLKALETFPGGRYSQTSSSGDKGNQPIQQVHPDSLVSANTTPSSKKISVSSSKDLIVEQNVDDMPEDSHIGVEVRGVIADAAPTTPLPESLLETPTSLEQYMEVENHINMKEIRVPPSGSNKEEEAGLGGPSTVSQIKDSRRVHHPNVIFLSETKKSLKFTSTVCKKLGFGSRWHLERPSGTKGGLLVMWDLETEVKQIISNDLCIQMELRGEGFSSGVWMIFVYMNSDKAIRRRQWEFLIDKKMNWGTCWMIAGDWNDIISNEEKRGGLRRLESSFSEFRQFIEEMEMLEVDQQGSFFTWGNNRASDGYVEERLDKVFSSWDWMTNFPNMKVSNFYRSASDHNVILINTDTEVGKRRKRFLFDKAWVKMEGVTEAVKEGWQVEVEGSFMFQVHQEIKQTRMALLSWYKPIHRNSDKEIKQLTSKMEDMRKNGQNIDWKDWSETKTKLDDAHRAEEQFWRIKSRAMWLKAGDSNTRFFHAFTSQRRKTNSIHKLATRVGLICDKQDTIVAHISEFYSTLFTSEGTTDAFHANLLLEILQKYQRFSGQKVNLYKSSMFLSKNCSEGLKNNICSILNGVVVKRSSKYLGLPLGIGASKKEAFQYVVDSVLNKIGSWKNNFLSTAGKEVLVKSVLQALPVF
ncbi:Unknown protein, partial [Striga hermonthica]